VLAYHFTHLNRLEHGPGEKAAYQGQNIIFMQKISLDFTTKNVYIRIRGLVLL